MKMAAGLLLLVCAGAVLSSARAQDSYDGLPDDYKKGVDLALEHLNMHTGVHHHFRFLRSQKKSEIESGFGVKYLYHQFYLKPTKCAKGTTVSDPQTCPFRNDRPLIDCAVCYKTFQGGIEQVPKPYVHCVRKPALTEEMKASRVDHCNTMAYSNGAPSLLSSTGTE